MAGGAAQQKRAAAAMSRAEEKDRAANGAPGKSRKVTDIVATMATLHAKNGMPPPGGKAAAQPAAAAPGSASTAGGGGARGGTRRLGGVRNGAGAPGAAGGRGGGRGAAGAQTHSQQAPPFPSGADDGGRPRQSQSRGARATAAAVQGINAAQGAKGAGATMVERQRGKKGQRRQSATPPPTKKHRPAAPKSAPAKMPRAPRDGDNKEMPIELNSSSEEEGEPAGERVRRHRTRSSTGALVEQPKPCERFGIAPERAIMYPSADDPDSIKVKGADLGVLEEDEFLNDTVVDFYINYLLREELKRINSGVEGRVYIFNTFFNKKLDWLKSAVRKDSKATRDERLRQNAAEGDACNDNEAGGASASADAGEGPRAAGQSGGGAGGSGDPRGDASDSADAPDAPNSDGGDPSQSQQSNHAKGSAGADAAPAVAEGAGSGAPSAPEPSKSKAEAELSAMIKWTKSVGLFDKDFLFLPLNKDLHWSLAILCHPSAYARGAKPDCDDGDIEIVDTGGDGCSSEVQPCLLHLDSLQPHHQIADWKAPLVRFLNAEWDDAVDKRRGLPPQHMGAGCQKPEFTTKKLPHMSIPDLPKQPNFCDCGLFMLHYIERFVQSAFRPVDAAHPDALKVRLCGTSKHGLRSSVKDIQKTMAPFLSREWFHKEGAMKLRARIRSILLSLFWEQGDEKEKRAMKELPAFEEWRKEHKMPWPPDRPKPKPQLNARGQLPQRGQQLPNKPKRTIATKTTEEGKRNARDAAVRAMQHAGDPSRKRKDKACNPGVKKFVTDTARSAADRRRSRTTRQGHEQDKTLAHDHHQQQQQRRAWRGATVGDTADAESDEGSPPPKKPKVQTLGQSSSDDDDGIDIQDEEDDVCDNKRVPQPQTFSKTRSQQAKSPAAAKKALHKTLAKLMKPDPPVGSKPRSDERGSRSKAPSKPLQSINEDPWDVRGGGSVAACGPAGTDTNAAASLLRASAQLPYQKPELQVVLTAGCVEQWSHGEEGSPA